MEKIDRIDEMMRKALQDNIWGDFTNFMNSFFGMDLGIYQGLGLAVLFMILGTFVAFSLFYFSIGPLLKNRPGATGFLETISGVNEYVFPSPFYFYAVRFCTSFVVLLVTYYFLMIVYLQHSQTFFSLLAPPALVSAAVVILFSSWEDSFFKTGGFITGYVGKGWFKKVVMVPKKLRKEHILVNAPSGGGKTSAYVVPQLIMDAHDPEGVSAFMLDVKPDGHIRDEVAAAWTAQGKKVVEFNPWDEDSDFSFNPLMYCGDVNDPKTFAMVEILVDSIFKAHAVEIGVKQSDSGEFFIAKEKEFLIGLIYAVLASPPEYRSFTAIYDLLKRPMVDLLGFIEATESTFVLKELQWYMGQKEDKREDFKSGLKTKLQVFGRPDIKHRFINNDLDLEALFKEPTLFILKAPLSVPGATNLASMIVRLMLFMHSKNAPVMKKSGMCMWYYFDEFGSLKIPNISNVVTTLRSQNGGILILLHDRADIFSISAGMQGVNSSESLDASLKTQIILSQSQQDTCKHYAERLGDAPFIDKERNRSIFSILAFSWRTVTKEAKVMTQDSIQSMAVMDALVFMPMKRGILLTQMRSYKHKRFSRFEKMPYVLHVNESERVEHGNLDMVLYGQQGDMDDIIERINVAAGLEPTRDHEYDTSSIEGMGEMPSKSGTVENERKKEIGSLDDTDSSGEIPKLV